MTPSRIFISSIHYVQTRSVKGEVYVVQGTAVSALLASFEMVSTVLQYKLNQELAFCVPRCLLAEQLMSTYF